MQECDRYASAAACLYTMVLLLYLVHINVGTCTYVALLTECKDRLFVFSKAFRSY